MYDRSAVPVKKETVSPVRPKSVHLITAAPALGPAYAAHCTSNQPATDWRGQQPAFQLIC